MPSGHAPQEALALLLLGVLGALLLVQLKTPMFAPSRPPAAGARSGQPRISPYRWIPCPWPPDPGAASLHRPVGPAARHYVQNEQTGGTEVDRQGCRKEKCREALCSRLLLLPLVVVVPGSGWTCPEWCARRCCSKSFVIKIILKSAASGSSMTSCAAPAAHAGCTRRRPGRRDSAGALPVRWSVRYPDRPRMPAAGLHRPPSRSARTTWPLWGSSLRAPSVAGDLPPPQRPTRFSQPPATLLPANRGGQADSPMARPARRSAAPWQQHQPGLRAAASSSAEHGES
jgi:hypothetical protein